MKARAAEDGGPPAVPLDRAGQLGSVSAQVVGTRRAGGQHGQRRRRHGAADREAGADHRRSPSSTATRSSAASACSGVAAASGVSATDA